MQLSIHDKLSGFVPLALRCFLDELWITPFPKRFVLLLFRVGDHCDQCKHSPSPFRGQ